MTFHIFGLRYQFMIWGGGDGGGNGRACWSSSIASLHLVLATFDILDLTLCLNVHVNHNGLGTIYLLSRRDQYSGVMLKYIEYRCWLILKRLTSDQTYEIVSCGGINNPRFHDQCTPQPSTEANSISPRFIDYRLRLVSYILRASPQSLFHASLHILLGPLRS